MLENNFWFSLQMNIFQFSRIFYSFFSGGGFLGNVNHYQTNSAPKLQPPQTTISWNMQKKLLKTLDNLLQFHHNPLQLCVFVQDLLCCVSCVCKLTALVIVLLIFVCVCARICQGWSWGCSSLWSENRIESWNLRWTHQSCCLYPSLSLSHTLTLT